MVEPALLLFSLSSAATLFVSSPSQFLIPGALYVPLFLVALDRSYLLSRRSVFRKAWNLLSLLYLPLFVFDLASGGEVIAPVARLLYFLQIAKLFDRHTSRDRLQLLAISFLQVLASSVITTEATLLLGLLIFFASALALLMVLALLKDGGEAAPAAPVLRFSLTLGVPILFGAALIFFLVPRLSLGYLQRMRAQDQMVSGFSDHMDLDLVGSIKKDSSVVMRVKRLDDAGPLDRPIYWRGLSYGTYDGKQWIKASRSLSLPRPAENTYSLDKPEGDAPTVELEFVVEPMDSEIVFVAGRPLTIAGQFFWLQMDENRTLYSRYQRYYRISYTEKAEIPDVPREVPDAPVPASFDRYLEMPAGEERIVDMAGEIVAGTPSKFDACRKIEEYLRTHYTYTLDLRRVESLSAVDDFLFNQRQGHCEYFATAMALLCRAAGVPSRVVSGFLEGEFNQAGNFYAVRQQDAHAWVEAYFPGAGWLQFDPSPVAVDNPVRARVDLSTLIRNYWDSFELIWDRYVLTYNLWDQFYLAMEVSEAMRAARDAVSRVIGSMFGQVAERGGGRHWLGVAGVLAGCLVVVKLFRRGAAAAGSAAPRQGGRRASHATRAYLRFLRDAARHGYRKPEQETAIEFARRFPSEKRKACCELVEIYYASRFGTAENRAADEEIRRLGRMILAQ